MDPRQDLEPLLLRVEEAAGLASLGRSKAYEMVASGEWPSVAIGRCRRVPLDGLRRWVEQQAAEADRSLLRRP
jgi:excisionase family DNA binding protein